MCTPRRSAWASFARLNVSCPTGFPDSSNLPRNRESLLVDALSFSACISSVAARVFDLPT
jgi:hypothetical protein